MSDETKPSGEEDSTKVTGSRFKYELGNSSGDGVFHRIEATYGEGMNRAYIYRAGKGDEDLLERHQDIVSSIQSWIPEKYAAFYPTFLEAGDDKNGKWIAAEYSLNDGWYSLREVAREYRTGVSGRDAVWIFKRILVAIGNASDVDVIHGAVNEDNVFIHPEQHGLVLDGWGYSIDKGERMIALPPGRTEDYPASIGTCQAPDDLDVILAAKMMLRLMEGEPKLLRRFFNNLASQHKYNHPSLVVAELESVAEEVYGPPAFSVFKMPKNS